LIQVNVEKLGYVADAIISIAVASQDNLMASIEKIERIQDVIGFWKTVGINDLDIFVKIRTIEQLIAIQDEVSSLPGVTKIQMLLLNRFPLMPYPKEHISSF
jgi:hypothetical protein